MLRFLQLPTHFLPGALPSSDQGWFLASSSHSPLCPGTAVCSATEPSVPRAVSSLAGLTAAPLLTCLGCRIGSGIPVELLPKLLSYDVFKESGCSVVAGTCSHLLILITDWWNWYGCFYCLVFWGAWGFCSVCEAVWKVRCLCTTCLLWGHFAPGPVDLCTTAWAKHLCTVNSFCFSAEILLKLWD